MSELSLGLYLAAVIILLLIGWHLIARASLITVSLLAIILAILLHDWLFVTHPQMKPVAPVAPVPIVVTATSVPASIVISDDGAASSEMTMVQAEWSQVPPRVARWRSQIEAAAVTCGVDPMLVAAVMTQESRGDPNVCSNMGACGPMQLMPGTARDMNVAERFDPAQNILGGTCYLRRMLDRYHQELDIGLAAYNAGPGNVDKYGGVPPFAETQKYVHNVQHFYSQFAAQSPTKFPSPPVAGSYQISGGYSGRHPGLDIVGAKVLLAVMDGVVRYVGPLYRSADGDARCLHIGCLGPYGIVLEHGSGTFSVYGHNSCSYVQAGQKVQVGQPIGCVGNEGKSTGPHLHFELRINEAWNDEPGWPWHGDYQSAADPTPYLP